jgi:hypothetical protein
MPTLVVGMFDHARKTSGVAKQAWPWHPLT